jgi:intergrase/recombinase
MNQIEKEAEAMLDKAIRNDNDKMFNPTTYEDDYAGASRMYVRHDIALSTIKSFAQQQADKMAVEWISVKEQNPPIKRYVDVWVEERKMAFMAYMNELFQWQCALIDLSGVEIKYFKRRDFEPPKEKGYE